MRHSRAALISVFSNASCPPLRVVVSPAKYVKPLTSSWQKTCCWRSPFAWYPSPVPARQVRVVPFHSLTYTVRAWEPPCRNRYTE